ncbi:MAG: VOC family protein [Deltaproteobacteria bacterium]|nr:VOC family protein [Deltaproteobacteria bacterium]
MTVDPDGAPRAPVPPLGIAAVLLFAADPTALASFYREQLGIPLVAVNVPGLNPHWGCDLGAVYFSIWPLGGAPGSATPRGEAGVAFHVRSAARDFERLRAAGVAVEFAPRSTPLGIVARLRDPDGNPFELYQSL